MINLPIEYFYMLREFLPPRHEVTKFHQEFHILFSIICNILFGPATNGSVSLQHLEIQHKKLNSEQTNYRKFATNFQENWSQI